MGPTHPFVLLDTTTTTTTMVDVLGQDVTVDTILDLVLDTTLDLDQDTTLDPVALEEDAVGLVLDIIRDPVVAVEEDAVDLVLDITLDLTMVSAEILAQFLVGLRDPVDLIQEPPVIPKIVAESTLVASVIVYT